MSQEFHYGKGQEIVVTLPQKAPLLKAHVLDFQDIQSSLSPSYLRQIKNIIAFDFNHNGQTKISNTNQDASKQEDQNLAQFNASFWRAQGIYYVIKGEIKDKALTLALFSTPDEKIRTSNPIQLTGNLNQDRTLLHKVSDSFYLALFGKPGIASTKIIYSVRKKQANATNQWTSEIFQSDYDGGNPQQLTRENNYSITPSFFPAQQGLDQSHFFYVSYITGQPKIYIANAQNPASKQRLTSLRGNQFMPILSPEGNKVAFISDASGRADLFLLNFDLSKGPVGKPYQAFSAPHATQASPCFSPDGKQIAFVSDKDGQAQIYAMSVPNPGTRLSNLSPMRISKSSSESTAPAWSPDGTKIAYSSRVNGVRQIWIYDVKTQTERQVTSGGKHKENPSWSPDSQHLVFNTADDVLSELFLISINDKEAVQITSGQGEKRFPSWKSS